ncbi:hypothetical protein OSB04_021961 [Centaurea solstitialis]|uniref:PB1 domain-containing protein n=1 Tax=Centaurea solstitialis TaxID=347529 RepID=A0AA38SVG3_9ASTR|nr:hypothetical protein OSB04_021961 [Centaurea solstitialis]
MAGTTPKSKPPASNSFAVTVARSSLVIPTASSVTAAAKLASSPSTAPSLSPISKLWIWSFEANMEGSSPWDHSPVIGFGHSLGPITANEWDCPIGGPMPLESISLIRVYVTKMRFGVCRTELLEKLGEICRTPAVALRCQLPTEDLDALVSITCDEDLVNLIEEYDRKTRVQSSSNLKIRAFLTLAKKSSSIPSRRSAYGFSSSTSIDLEIPSSPRSPSSSSSYSSSTARFPIAGKSHYIQQVSRKHPLRSDRSAGKLLRYACENSSQSYLVHNGNHWQ